MTFKDCYIILYFIGNNNWRNNISWSAKICFVIFALNCLLRQGCGIINKKNGLWYTDWGEEDFHWSENNQGRGCYDVQNFVCDKMKVQYKIDGNYLNIIKVDIFFSEKLRKNYVFLIKNLHQNLNRIFHKLSTKWCLYFVLSLTIKRTNNHFI